MGIGQGNNLPGITGVCQCFLIPGHGCIENDLTGGFSWSTDGIAAEYCAICKCQDCRDLLTERKLQGFLLYDYTNYTIRTVRSALSSSGQVLWIGKWKRYRHIMVTVQKLYSYR